MLYALRGARGSNKFCAAELHTNRNYSTVKDITTKPTEHYTVLDNDNNFQIEMSDFPENRTWKSGYKNGSEGPNMTASLSGKNATSSKKHGHNKQKKRPPTTYSKGDVAIPNDVQATT